MGKFFLKSFLAICIMFIAVLFGMELAQNGIQKMRGFEDESFAEAIDIQEDDGEVAVSLLGEEVSSHDIQQKKEKLEQIKAFNFFSNLGKMLAEGVSKVIEKVIQGIFG